MTQTTTARAVSGTSMYIHHPVKASAMPIWSRYETGTHTKNRQAYRSRTGQENDPSAPAINKVPSGEPSSRLSRKHLREGLTVEVYSERKL